MHQRPHRLAKSAGWNVKRKALSPHEMRAMSKGQSPQKPSPRPRIKVPNSDQRLNQSPSRWSEAKNGVEKPKSGQTAGHPRRRVHRVHRINVVSKHDLAELGQALANRPHRAMPHLRFRRRRRLTPLFPLHKHPSSTN